MHSPILRRGAVVFFILLLSIALPALADAPVPRSVLEPQTAPEAWNVIRLATANVEQLVREKRWPEIPVQIAFCSPALRMLSRVASRPEVAEITQRASGWVVAAANASLENNEARTVETLKTLRTLLDALAAFFDPKSVAADIFICPMHPDFLSDRITTPCAKCAMTLMPRRIPYSFIYATPGKPTVRIAATTEGPIEAGRKLAVKVQLEKGGGAPVSPADLIVMHTQPIHLLIEDPSLSDYHHEHPAPTGTPGEYAFTFTPAKTAPYRVWADIVPTSSGVQELPFVDLPSTGKGEPIANTANRFSCTSGGLRFDLSFPAGAEAMPHARQTCALKVIVTDEDGRPVDRLEPLMNAFAHLVGFYEDRETVVHIHPGGGEITRDDARGGPSLFFTFFPPKAGFLRLYCQVMIGGKNVFAPFNVNVLP